MARNLLERYAWLVETLRRNGRLALSDIQERWQQSPLFDGSELSRRTFLNHLKGVRDAFGLQILCDTHDHYRYFISEPTAAQRRTAQLQLADTLWTAAGADPDGQLAGRILLAQPVPRPRTFELVAEAMRRGRCLEVVVDDGRTDLFSETPQLLEPYGLVVHLGQWHLVAHAPSDHTLRCLPLSALRSVSIREAVPFAFPAGFDLAAWLSGFVALPASVDFDARPASVRLSVDAPLLRKLSAQPFHFSQRISQQTEEGATVDFSLVPTPELACALLSLGAGAEVIKPETLRKEVRAQVKEMRRVYRDKNK